MTGDPCGIDDVVSHDFASPDRLPVTTAMEPIGFMRGEWRIGSGEWTAPTPHSLLAIRHFRAKPLIFGGFSASFALTPGSFRL
jgi:hypothetical protein